MLQVLSSTRFYIKKKAIFWENDFFDIKYYFDSKVRFILISNNFFVY